MIRISMKWAPHGHHEEEIENSKIDDAIRWCKNKFGSCMYDNPKWNYIGMGEFEFLNEEDAVLFALRCV